MKRFLLSALAAVTFSAASVSTANAVTTAEATKYVESLGNQAVGIISNAKLSKQQKQVKLEKIFSDNVDIPWVGRFVMGRFWKQATPEQQKAYIREYEKFVVSHYASRFAEYSTGKFNITNTRDDGDGEVTVSMEMLSGESGAQPVFVEYRIHGDKPKVFDVSVEGVSMITTQRSEFGALLNDKGIDYLISKLASKSLKLDTASK